MNSCVCVYGLVVVALIIFLVLIAHSGIVRREHFVSPTAASESYLRARASSLPPPCIDGDSCASAGVLPGNAHETRSSDAWTYSIRPPSSAMRRIFIAPDAVNVIVANRPWHAVHVSSDADTYPETVAAVRSLVADVFNDNKGGNTISRPQLRRALVRGCWDNRPAVGGQMTANTKVRTIWRLLVCFRLPSTTASEGDGRCFEMDILHTEDNVERTMVTGMSSSKKYHILFARELGHLDGATLAMPIVSKNG